MSESFRGGPGSIVGRMGETVKLAREFEPRTGIPAFEFYNDSTGREHLRFLDIDKPTALTPTSIEAARFIPDRDKVLRGTCFDPRTNRIIRNLIGSGLREQVFRAIIGLPGLSKTHGVTATRALMNEPRDQYTGSVNSTIEQIIGQHVPGAKLEITAEQIKQFFVGDEFQKIREMADAAIHESRNFHPWEKAVISAVTGLPLGQWDFQLGFFPGAMKWGTNVVLDEWSNVPPGTREALNTALDYKNIYLLVPGYQGNTAFRPLKESEREAFEKGDLKSIPGVVLVNKNFRADVTMNPDVVGGDRVPLTPAEKSRFQALINDPLVPEDVMNHLTFAGEGREPQMIYTDEGGRQWIFEGRNGVQTDYRDFSRMPNWEYFKQFETELHFALIKAIKGPEKTIGSLRNKEGGFYEIENLRSIWRLMDSMRNAQSGLLDLDALFNNNQVRFTGNWYDVIHFGWNQEYLSGMYKADRELIEKRLRDPKLIKMFGGEEGVFPAEWEEQATASGLHVVRDKKGVTLTW